MTKKSKRHSAKKDINILDLSSIFQSLSGAKRSGTLRVYRSGEEKLVYFRKGNVEYVTAPRKKHLLGEALIKYGAITEEQLREALRKQKGWNVDLGGALLKLEFVGEDEIRKALVFQITEEVCDIFAWPDVHCEFVPGEPPEDITKLSKEGVHVSVNPESLVMEAARRIDELEILKEILPSMKDVLVATPRAVHYYDEATGNEAEMEVLSCIDGVRDVSEVVEKARMSKFDVLKTLYKLISAGEVAPIAPVQLVQLAFNCASTGQLEKCVRLYERALELGVTDLDLDMRLAETYEALGEGEKATEMYGSHASEAANDAHEKLIETLIENDLRGDAIKEATKMASKLIELKEESRTISLWQHMKEFMPDNPVPYRNLADLHASGGHTVQAIIELENLAGLYQVNNNPDQAIETLREMLRLDRECVQARLSLAATLADMGDTEAAVTEYNTLAETLSKSGVIHDSGNWTFLIDIYEKILDLEPGNILAREWLAKAYIDNEMIDKALPSLRQIAEMKRAEGRLGEIPDPLKQIVKLQPEDMDTRMELAKVYLELGDIVHATKVYQEVIRMSLDKKEFGLAQRAAAKILNADPHNLVAHKALADMYADVGEKEKQLMELCKVGWLSYCGGDFKAAAKSFEAVLKLEMDSLDIALVLPRAYELLGDKRKAFDCYLSLAQECVRRNNLGLARWASERASLIDGASNKVDRILSRVDDKEEVLRKGARFPTIERPKDKSPQPVIDKRDKKEKE
jgi:tetratricopeptide (TPR) repeat protein